MKIKLLNNRMIMLFVFIVLFSSCRLTVGSQLREISPELGTRLQESDIIFVTEENELGIYNLDGKEDRIPLNFPLIYRITYWRNEEVLIYNSQDSTGKGYYIHENGFTLMGYSLDLCFMVSLLPDSESVLYLTNTDLLLDNDKDATYEEFGLAQFTEEAGSELVTAILYKQQSYEAVEQCILGTNSIYNDNLYYKDILLSGENGLIELDLETDTKTAIFTADIIMAPAISPNGDKIAFTQRDGIYIYSFETGDTERIVEDDWFDSVDKRFHFDKYGFPFAEYVPVASWSPDGNKIVFSRVTFFSRYDTDPDDERFDIYIYDLETGEETLIIKDGFSPYWILY